MESYQRNLPLSQIPSSIITSWSVLSVTSMKTTVPNTWNTWTYSCLTTHVATRLAVLSPMKNGAISLTVLKGSLIEFRSVASALSSAGRRRETRRCPGRPCSSPLSDRTCSRIPFGAKSFSTRTRTTKRVQMLTSTMMTTVFLQMTSFWCSIAG